MPNGFTPFQGGFGGVEPDAFTEIPSAMCGCSEIGYSELVQFLVDNRHRGSCQEVIDRLLKQWRVVKR